MVNVVISGTGLWTPAESISNEELVAAFDAYADLYNTRHAAAIAAGELRAMGHSNSEFIVKASGIRSRHVLDKAGILDPQRLYPRIAARPDEALSVQAEMGVQAAREALAQAGRRADEIDGVIVACSNMQRAYPAMAIEVQQALGVQGFAFDMNVACSSATFGIQVAVDMLRAGSARRLLMVNPEICSGHLEWRDRDCHFIFGDVATAVVLECDDAVAATATPWQVLGTRLQTQFSNNIRNNFGFLNRCEDAGCDDRDKLFMQEGRKVFKEVCPMVAEQISAHISDLQLLPEDLRRLWLHQANLNMNDLIARRVMGREVTRDEAPIILDRYANTSSAGSIIAFHLHRQDMAAGSHGVICSFGAGYSVGSVVVRKC